MDYVGFGQDAPIVAFECVDDVSVDRESVQSSLKEKHDPMPMVANKIKYLPNKPSQIQANRPAGLV
jgi:hypothetical protein